MACRPYPQAQCPPGLLQRRQFQRVQRAARLSLPPGTPLPTPQSGRLHLPQAGGATERGWADPSSRPRQEAMPGGGWETRGRPQKAG